MAHLRIILADTAIFVSRDDVLGQETPPRHSGLALSASNAQAWFFGLLVQVFELAITVGNVEDRDRTEETHSLFCHCQELASIRRKCHPLHSRREFPDLHALARLDVP